MYSRVDLGLALRFGCTPVFFYNDISWDPHISGNRPNSSTTSAQASENNIVEYLGKLDRKLVNVLQDLREFSRLSNIAYQTSSKFLPNSFSEIMVSVLYRLMNLSFAESPIEDAIRVGMMAFVAAIFFRWRGMRQRQQYLDDAFQASLQRLEHASAQPPFELTLWLLIMWNICVADQPGNGLFVEWLDDIIFSSHCRSWVEARDVLKSVIWINFMHDPCGKMVFDTVLSRIKERDS